MVKPPADSYDAVIIGAGISGLVCGCYLARSGLKVVVAEQHHKPGGYCTTFKRRGFTFDAAAHSFGGYKYGPLGKVFRDLGIDKKLHIRRFEPTDVVVTNDFRVSFGSDVEKTIQGFQAVFPEERNSIARFFSFLFMPDPNSFSRIRSWTFGKLLDKYFTNEKLKAVLSFPLFGNGGLPPSMMSAFIGSKIFKEYLLDGGYYPEGNMQTLADTLAETFREFGGELRLSSRAREIRVKEGNVSGVTINKADFIPARYVISNCDARQTFYTLLGRRLVREDIVQRIDDMIPSLSIFILYLGVDNACGFLPPGINMWVLRDYDVEKAYVAAKKADIDAIHNYMVRLSPDQKTILAFLNVGFKSKAYWDIHKKEIMDLFIAKLERDITPGLSKHIVYSEAATPSTLHRYTSNYKGAAYGWACTPSQLADPELRKPSFIQGLYLTGHWTTQGLGIPGVVYVGYDTARLILRKERMWDKLSL
jgi:phytoene dehydrogenase-like protein